MSETRACSAWKLTPVERNSRTMNQIARELAVNLGGASFRPDVIKHTPRVASATADVLTRRFCPGAECGGPSQLHDAPEDHRTRRDI